MTVRIIVIGKADSISAQLEAIRKLGLAPSVRTIGGRK